MAPKNASSPSTTSDRARVLSASACATKVTLTVVIPDRHAEVTFLCVLDTSPTPHRWSCQCTRID